MASIGTRPQGALIEAMHGTHIDRCRQILTIGQATPDIAALLNVPVNYPMGDIRRVITDPDGVIIYWNDVSYRGDLVRFEIDLDLESGGTSTPPSPNAGAAMIC